MARGADHGGRMITAHGDGHRGRWHPPRDAAHRSHHRDDHYSLVSHLTHGISGPRPPGSHRDHYVARAGRPTTPTAGRTESHKGTGRVRPL
jgi:hypothetical protein